MNDIQNEKALSSVYVIMGVSGSGKTTVGNLVAQNFNCIFMEGDEFHPEANVKKMSSGQALNDEDRLPWLQNLSESAAAQRQSTDVIIACSALKRSYRDVIRRYISDAKFIHLKGSADYIEKLIASRNGHFMPLSLLRSQFETLESLGPDETGITIPIESGMSAVLAQIEVFILNAPLLKAENVK